MQIAVFVPYCCMQGYGERDFNTRGTHHENLDESPAGLKNPALVLLKTSCGEAPCNNKKKRSKVNLRHPLSCPPAPPYQFFVSCLLVECCLLPISFNSRSAASDSAELVISLFLPAKEHVQDTKLSPTLVNHGKQKKTDEIHRLSAFELLLFDFGYAEFVPRNARCTPRTTAYQLHQACHRTNYT